MKNTKLNITLIQSNLHWENKDKNIETFDNCIAKVKNSDIIILPEMFTTGFSMNTKLLAETMEGETLQWMKLKAKKGKVAICGSLIIKENKKYFNRFCFVLPNGDVFTYDKRHLFSPAGENKFYTKGKEKIIINYKGWNITPFVCYDLRFPVWSRVNKNESDVLIYVANWPKARNYAWKQLLIARAIENQSFVVGVNRIGKDAKGNEHNGSSCVVDAFGKVILDGKENSAWIKSITIDKTEMNTFRNNFSFSSDADEFTIQH